MYGMYEYVVSKPILPGKECGQPGQPAHGRLVSTEVLFYPGEEVTYSCDPGYVLTGSERRLCGEDGAWSGALPACSEWIIHYLKYIYFSSTSCRIPLCNLSKITQF